MSNYDNPLEEEVYKKMNMLIHEVRSKEFLQWLGDEAVELIRKRTRLGYGVVEHGQDKYKLPPHSEYYIEERKKMHLHSTTTAKKSNATLTGQMLEQLKAVVNQELGMIIGWKEGSFAESKAISCNHHGIVFNKLSQAEINQLRKKIQDRLNKVLQGN